MSFDEQPDGDPHGECAAEIARLNAALLAANKNISELCRQAHIRGKHAAWEELTARFSPKKRAELANLFAHSFMIESMTIHDYYGSRGHLLQADLPLKTGQENHDKARKSK